MNIDMGSVSPMDPDMDLDWIIASVRLMCSCTNPGVHTLHSMENVCLSAWIQAIVLITLTES